MIVERNFLNKLKAFGLNSYEAKIWTALLSRGISSAGELSDISNVPRSRSYDVLENLEKKGFIIMKIGKPIKYIAIPPEDVLERVKKRIKTDADKEMVALDKLKESELLKELNLLHNKGLDVVDPTDLSGALKSRDQVYSQLHSMIKNAKESIMVVTTAEGLVDKMRVLKNGLERANKRKVSIKVAAPIDKVDARLLDQVSSFGEIRHVDHINSRFFIVDNKEIVFMLGDENTNPDYDAGIWVTSKFFVDGINEMFKSVWENAKIPALKSH